MSDEGGEEEVEDKNTEERRRRRERLRAKLVEKVDGKAERPRQGLGGWNDSILRSYGLHVLL